MRKFTNEAIQMAEDGVILWETIARTALGYMSEDDVRDMVLTNDLLFDYDEEEDNDDDE